MGWGMPILSILVLPICNRLIFWNLPVPEDKMGFALYLQVHRLKPNIPVLDHSASCLLGDCCHLPLRHHSVCPVLLSSLYNWWELRRALPYLFVFCF